MENQNNDQKISYEERLFCELILRQSRAPRFSKIAADTLGEILKRDFGFKEFSSVIIRKEPDTGINLGRLEDPEAEIVKVAEKIAEKAVIYAQERGRRTIKVSDIEAVASEIKSHNKI